MRAVQIVRTYQVDIRVFFGEVPVSTRDHPPGLTRTPFIGHFRLLNRLETSMRRSAASNIFGAGLLASPMQDRRQQTAVAVVVSLRVL